VALAGSGVGARVRGRASIPADYSGRLFRLPTPADYSGRRYRPTIPADYSGCLPRPTVPAADTGRRSGGDLVSYRYRILGVGGGGIGGGRNPEYLKIERPCIQHPLQ